MIKYFIDSLKQCKQQLQEMGLLVSNWILSLILLHNLKDAYESFVSSMLQNICGIKPDLNQIVSQLLDKERQQININKTTALLTKKKKVYCSHCDRSNHTKDNCWRLHLEKAPKDRDGKRYHKDKANKKDKTKKKEDNNKEKNGDVFMCASLLLSFKKTNTWFIDLGATQHMCVNQNVFTNYIHVKI